MAFYSAATRHFESALDGACARSRLPAADQSDRAAAVMAGVVPACSDHPRRARQQ